MLVFKGIISIGETHCCESIEPFKVKGNHSCESVVTIKVNEKFIDVKALLLL
ncbi:10232_t:CDS:1, partial [Dentiscutata erythropus]